jgi:hypothetical protein
LVWVHRDCGLGGTAIRATGVERDSCRRPPVDEQDAEFEHASLVSGLATLFVAAIALVLAALPAIVALRVVDLPVGWVGAGLGLLGAAMGGVKLAAMAWAVAGRLPAGPPERAAVAAAD